VGEVDQLDDAVDERVSERDEGVDRAEADAQQKDAYELLRRAQDVPDDPDQKQRNNDPREDAVDLLREPGEGGKKRTPPASGAARSGRGSSLAALPGRSHT
jgi:hypothetical protein